MISLLENIAVPISDFHRNRILVIQNEDYSGVVRKVRETHPDVNTEEGILALQQYYAVALLDPLNEHAVSDTVDPFWHNHILHTRQYAVFCENVFGQFVHHEPLNKSDSEEVLRVKRLYEYTAGLYRRMFRYTNRDFFPRDLSLTRIICTHYRITNPAVENEALFPKRIAA